MNNPLILFSTVLLFALCTQNTFGQKKYEKESRITPQSAPSAAFDFINAIEITSRIKWYAEAGFESKSIEAKFKLENKRHSVEFDTTGIIQDVEIEMKWIELPSQAKDSIHSELSRNCSRFKISKIQIQYSGSQSQLLPFLKGEAASEHLIINYEIIAKCANKKAELLEYLFNAEGKLLKASKIIFKNSSNLEY